MNEQHLLPPVVALSVPSPLVGSEASEARFRGQGGGCRTARSFSLSSASLHVRSPKARSRRTPFPGLPPSPALPHKGGGSETCSRLHESPRSYFAGHPST
jgi:hypothetical protein